MKALGIIAVSLCGGLLIYAASDFPPWSDPASPASTHVSPYYIETTMADTSVPNIVTAILADYRGFDTLFETVVIFTAAISGFFLLRIIERKDPKPGQSRQNPTTVTGSIKGGENVPKESDESGGNESEGMRDDLVIKVTCRLIVPFILLFGLYVIAHGHYSPGGGFQGGVILGAALILYALSHDLRSAIARISEKVAVFFYATGVFIYAGTGVLCVLLGKNFLDYGALATIFGVDPVPARSIGILMVEIGVGMAVMGVMISLYYNLSSAGKHDEGL